MGEALQLVVGGPEHGHALVFGVVAVLMQLFIPYRVPGAGAEMADAVAVRVCRRAVHHRHPVGEAAGDHVVPPLESRSDYLMLLVAVLGTTISPYLFFWQASQEVEEQRATDGDEPLRDSSSGARDHLRRIKLDTWLGMTFSNADRVLDHADDRGHAACNAGITDIQSSAQAAEALRPIAGEFAFWLFAAGIIGTGLLAIPVLAGSAAYAVAEAIEWPIGHGLEPMAGEGLLRHHRARHAGRHRARLHADRPDQGVAVERRDQRRGRRADHGGDDAHGRAARHHGRVHDHAEAAAAWLVRDGVMGLPSSRCWCRFSFRSRPRPGDFFTAGTPRPSGNSQSIAWPARAQRR